MILGMSKEEFRRAVGMWGIALCVYAAAAGWMFMRFGMAWSLGDLPESDQIMRVVPAYIVAEVAAIPVGGKLADRIGVRNIMAFAPFIFIIGCMLCMISPSIEVMVFFRVIQGGGAGLLLGMAFASVGEYYIPDKRGKCHELMTAAFAIGSLFGTAVGYFLCDNFGWRSGFIVLSVIVLAGFILAWIFLPEHEHLGRSADPLGLAFAAVVFGGATLYTQMINEDIELISIPSFLILAVIIVFTYLLMRHCHRSEDPAIPVRISIFEKKMIVLMFMFSLCGLGLIQYFFKLYLTYYEFNIYKASAMFALLILGAAGPAMLGGKLVFKTGAMPWIIVGSSIVTIGLMLTNLIADQSILGLGISLFVFGMGLGCIVTEILCSVQAIAPTEHVGQHTGNLMAVRMLGILAGNAVVGTYISNVVDARRDHTPIDMATVDDLLAEVVDHVKEGIHAVAESLDTGFVMTVIIMAMITTLLTAMAHTLGKEDAEAIIAFNEANPEPSEDAGESGSE